MTASVLIVTFLLWDLNNWSDSLRSQRSIATLLWVCPFIPTQATSFWSFGWWSWRC